MRKRRTPSWNAQTRRVVEARLAVPVEPRFLTASEYVTLQAVAARLVPQPAGRPPVPVAALVDAKLHEDRQEGYRGDGMPRQREAWRRGLRALDAEACARHGARFHALDGAAQDTLLRRMQQGELDDAAWEGMPPKTFFSQRLAHDVVAAYWSHPTAWSEMGWGGPASPRGYVRMGFDERDPWEAAEIRDGDRVAAMRKNLRVG
nr:gluconate 2-dehydrogenase subunit 3 family protein [Roseomonas acroporae]